MSAFQLKALRWGRVSRRREYFPPENTARKKDSWREDRAGSDMEMRNDAGTVQENSHKNRTECSEKVLKKNENPGALAGATGDNLKSWLDWVDHNIRRETAARALMEALLACDPSDRLELLERFYDALRAGFPIVAFDSLMVEAAFWADRASTAELKAYGLACYTRMSPADQSSFLAYVQKGDV